MPPLDEAPGGPARRPQLVGGRREPAPEHGLDAVGRGAEDGQLGRHPGREAPEVLIPDVGDDRLAQCHGLHRESAVPADEELVHHEIGGLVDLARLLVAQALDEAEAEVDPGGAQAFDGGEYEARPLHAAVGRGVDHQGRLPSPRDADLGPVARIHMGVGLEARPRRQDREQVRIDGVDQVRMAVEGPDPAPGGGVGLCAVVAGLPGGFDVVAGAADVALPGVVSLEGHREDPSGRPEEGEVAELQQPGVGRVARADRGGMALAEECGQGDRAR